MVTSRITPSRTRPPLDRAASRPRSTTPSGPSAPGTERSRSSAAGSADASALAERVGRKGHTAVPDALESGARVAPDQMRAVLVENEVLNVVAEQPIVAVRIGDRRDGMA